MLLASVACPDREHACSRGKEAAGTACSKFAALYKRPDHTSGLLGNRVSRPCAHSRALSDANLRIRAYLNSSQACLRLGTSHTGQGMFVNQIYSRFDWLSSHRNDAQLSLTSALELLLTTSDASTQSRWQTEMTNMEIGERMRSISGR